MRLDALVSLLKIVNQNNENPRDEEVKDTTNTSIHAFDIAVLNVLIRRHNDSESNGRRLIELESTWPRAAKFDLLSQYKAAFTYIFNDAAQETGDDRNRAMSVGANERRLKP